MSFFKIAQGPKIRVFWGLDSLKYSKISPNFVFAYLSRRYQGRIKQRPLQIDLVTSQTPKSDFWGSKLDFYEMLQRTIFRFLEFIDFTECYFDIDLQQSCSTTFLEDFKPFGFSLEKMGSFSCLDLKNQKK